MDELLQKITNAATLLCPDLEENTHTLERKIEFLKSRKVDVQADSENAGKKRKREVEDWLINVASIITEFETLKQEILDNNSRFYSRQRLAERVERMTKEVMELVEQSDFLRGLFLEADESIGQLLLTPPHNGQAFLQNFNDIWASLMDDNVLSIGIYGMGGVGKTTVAMHAHDKILNESKFSGHVIWITVSQEFSIYKLQSDIAHALKLDFSSEIDEKKRAAQLFQTFLKRGSFVLVLDDVWKQIDAEKIGIPPRRDGCKLVITSRSKEVCHRMGCQRIIKVNTLSEQEAWELFLKKLGRVELHPEIEEICKKMVKRCCGLPLALITLAGSMRGVTDIHEWRDASEELKVSCMGRADMENEVLPILLYSYDRLRDPKLQRCFLYCSLYPEDYPIRRDELIENFISEELMDKRLSWRAENDQGHAILNQLERACLLESFSREDGHVKMHDLIRDMALRIIKDNPRYMVKAGLQLREIPDVQEWTEDLDKISLMYNDIGKISSGMSPKCPRLSTLILRGNPLKSIPDCFFTQMRGLRTLNLSDTYIYYLPNSISDLENLRTLLLRGCHNLKSVPTLEKLRLLTRLDLAATKIEDVPHGVESLTNLKVLDLVCPNLSMIPTGVLHRLSLLQQLKLPAHIAVPVEEVEALKQLEVFRGVVKSICDLNRLITFLQSIRPLSFYSIALSPKFSENPSGEQSSKLVAFEQNSLMDSSLGEGKILLPRDIETLIFSSSGLSSSLVDGFQMLNNAGYVKKCNVYREDEIECIIRLSSTEEQQSRGVLFQSLEELLLNGLPNFIGLFMWEGGAAVAHLLSGIFSQLIHLRISQCNKMKKLIPWSLLQTLPNLQKLEVTNCKEIEEIIGDDDDGSPAINSSADVTMSKLKILKLFDLPELKSICKGRMICDSIEKIEISQCRKLKKVPPLDGHPSPPPSLKEIGAYGDEKEWWDSLEWENPNAYNFLRPFFLWDVFPNITYFL